MEEFSFRTRQQSIRRFNQEQFDLLIVGGGISGAAVARDAVSRGLKVALVERRDFASGTSSRSSKLIHGGLRYLEKLELGLVFEALSERSLLLRTAPHLVRPLEFFLPVYSGDHHGMAILNFGLWLYDLLALFRTPGFHKRLSKKQLISSIPFLKTEKLKGGFRYYDASMWDDALTVDTLRAASSAGAAIANYVEAVTPIWREDVVSGFRVKDMESKEQSAEAEIRASKVIVCAGPWTDLFGSRIKPNWDPWLSPSKGVHLVFDYDRIPVPGAVVMSHPRDGRISFVIPRKDIGAGVVIVGTTDGPTDLDPEQARVEASDVEYLFDLLESYFPDLKLESRDVVSTYVGVRPLVGIHAHAAGSEGQSKKARVTQETLQKVSREHFIGSGPGGIVFAAGGKYTTHRTMAKQIVDYALKTWKKEALKGKRPPVPSYLQESATQYPVNPRTMKNAVQSAVDEAARCGWRLPDELVSRFGAEAIELLEVDSASRDGEGIGRVRDPEGFPLLSAQLRFLMRTTMIIHLEDFFLRRVPLFLARKDHGLPWAEMLSKIWAEERGLGPNEARAELDTMKAAFKKSSL